ncbi:hypothetical protein P152DRAFT_34692 [Eremomyces bilateralis CBS 781.70]|uniref:Metallo-beta-lactamase domain-containing protein n=1 Tax=Eremomyces bilateralis CBS 781.70 TaxID=1392243 RepID=A0A6G1G336_9PEZI|nr:uncharacterized protein P152DRAFT_34692 [Eremomyces bilateralis CBS 781.70]KAF1812402.1 hypothetical protein P152DRAFT_34692 [Eremomyces bilateralis CBS 781.70]
MSNSEDFLICNACGTQYGTTSDLTACKICDDPRQYVPPSGQSWTTLGSLKAGDFENQFVADDGDSKITFLSTRPKFAIGQRAILLQTPSGNVLWDLITLIDEETVDFIHSIGGLKAIVISHPHYYSTHLEWAKRFNCPVYLAEEDKEWICRDEDPDNVRRFITRETETILPGVTAIKAGGHFPGSLLLHWENKLLIADTVMATPSGLYFKDRPTGTNSYSFMWSYPNMIPLSPDEIWPIWKSIKPFEFDTTHGAFHGLTIRDKDAKKRMLDSMQIQVRRSGHSKHGILEEAF